jgi:hypothetical protein
VFAIRDSTTNYVSLTAELNPTISQIQIYQQFSNGAWTVVFTTPTITYGIWNRLIFEFVQAQPTEFETGLCSGRVWINGVSTSRTYFCNFSSGYDLFADMGTAKIELCSRQVSGTPNVLDSASDSYSDIADFMWFKGAEGLFTNTSDATCAVTGFISLGQTVCLQCNSGYFLVDNQCQTQCPSDHFLYSPTNTCQKCQYNFYYVRLFRLSTFQ